MTCEHHVDRNTGFRHLLNMKCEYENSCEHKKLECFKNRKGWNIAKNECQEIETIDDQTGKTIVKFIEICEYNEPANTNEHFNEELQELLEFDSYSWVLKNNMPKHFDIY